MQSVYQDKIELVSEDEYAQLKFVLDKIEESQGKEHDRIRKLLSYHEVGSVIRAAQKDEGRCVHCGCVIKCGVHNDEAEADTEYWSCPECSYLMCNTCTEVATPVPFMCENCSSNRLMDAQTGEWHRRAMEQRSDYNIKKGLDCLKTVLEGMAGRLKLMATENVVFEGNDSEANDAILHQTYYSPSDAKPNELKDYDPQISTSPINPLSRKSNLRYSLQSPQRSQDGDFTRQHSEKAISLNQAESDSPKQVSLHPSVERPSAVIPHQLKDAAASVAENCSITTDQTVIASAQLQMLPTRKRVTSDVAIGGSVKHKESNRPRRQSIAAICKNMRGSIASASSSISGAEKFATMTPVTGQVRLSVSWKKHANELLVHVYEAEHLPLFHKKRPSTFVKLYLLPEKKKYGKQKTVLCGNNVSPTYNSTLKYQLEIDVDEKPKTALWFTVWHKPKFGRNMFLGELLLHLSELDFGESNWYSLQEHNAAAIDLLNRKVA